MDHLPLFPPIPPEADPPAEDKGGGIYQAPSPLGGEGWGEGADSSKT